MGAEGGVKRGRRGITAVGAIIIVAVFLVALTSLAAVFMEYSRFSDEVKRANQLVVAKETENLRVTRIDEDTILIENLGSTPSILTGYFKLNPAGNTPQYVKFPEPIVIPQLSSKQISVSTPNINWKVGVQTNAGNLFWEESGGSGGTWIGESIPPGQPIYVAFNVKDLGSDASSSNILVVDGSTYMAGELPKTFRWISGENHSFKWLSPVSGASGAQYIWVSTSGLSDKQADTLTVDRYGFVVASYMLQYSLTISAQPSEGGLTNPSPGVYWFNPGSSSAISASPSSDWKFERWVGSGSGSYSGTSSSATITVNGPITETAYFYTFTISVTPPSGSCQQGGDTSATVTVTLLGGYSASATISLSASNLPSGAYASFSPSSVTISPSSTTATSTMTISASATTPAGTYTIMVTASGDGISRTTTYTLSIQATIQLREFDPAANYNPDISFSTPSSGILEISSTAASLGKGYAFINLPKPLLDGRKLEIRWNVYYSYPDSRDLFLATLYVFDAAFDRHDMSSYFKPNTNSEPIFNYGNILATHYPGPLGRSGWLGWRIDTSSILDLSSFSSSTVTLLIKLEDGWMQQTVKVDVDYMRILDNSNNVVWSFNFDGSVNMEVTGTYNDYGLFTGS